MSEGEDRTIRWIDKIWESIPIILMVVSMLLAGVAGWLKLKWDVTDLVWY